MALSERRNLKDAKERVTVIGTTQQTVEKVTEGRGVRHKLWLKRKTEHRAKYKKLVRFVKNGAERKKVYIGGQLSSQRCGW